MSSQILAKTGQPIHIDRDIANTVDFHIASTDWTTVIDGYINHIAATYVWNFTHHTHDPITDQFRFFRAINEGTLPLRNSDRGGVDTKAGTQPHGDKDWAYLSKLDTLLEKHWVWVRTDTGFPETREGSTGATEYHAYDIVNRSDHWIEYEYNTRDDTQSKIANLEELWGMENLENDQEFLLYWMKKYRRAHDNVKDLYKRYIAAYDIAESENWFATVSDSVGLLHRRIDFPDTSLIPTMDIDFNLLGISPAVVDPIIHDKLDYDTDALLKDFSTKTNSLFRLNRSRQIRAIGSPNTSHGEIGCNDWIHWGRMMINYGHIQGHVDEVLGYVHNALGFISNATNNQKVQNPVFNMVIEDSIVKVDILKNKYHTLTSILTSRSTNDDVFKPVDNIIDRD